MRLPGMPVRTLPRRTDARRTVAECLRVIPGELERSESARRESKTACKTDGSPLLAAIGAGFAQPVSRPPWRLARDDARFREGPACGTTARTGSRFEHG